MKKQKTEKDHEQAVRIYEKDQKVWAVVDYKYGIVGLYTTWRLARKACDEGIGLVSGYAGTVRSIKVHNSIYEDKRA